MAEGEDRGVGSTILEPERTSSAEAKRRGIQFRRAQARDDDPFRDNSRTESSPRKQRPIPEDKKAEVTISDNRPRNSKTVKGKPPVIPEEKPDDKPASKRVTRRTRPTIEDSTNYAKFLLSAVEIACITAVGPTGEMTDWERGVIQAPLQRCIARTPLGVVEKGGLYIDIGFLTIGFGVYLTRVFKGVGLPSQLKPKPKVEVQEDTAAPVAAQAHTVVDTIKAGDVDGLAVPVPTAITNIMNGAI